MTKVTCGTATYDSWRFNSSFQAAWAEYVALVNKIRALPPPPHTDYWHRSLDEAIEKLYDAARYGEEKLPPGYVSERASPATEGTKDT